MGSPVFRSSRYWPFFWTQFSGAFNDNFIKNAILILMTFKGVQLAGVPTSMVGALCAGIFILPFFIFSAISGQLADRYQKRSIIRIVKAAEIGIMILAAIGFLGHFPLVLLTALFLMGLHSAIFGPLKYSILPQLLERDELLRGNAFVEMGTFIAILLGSILGGLLMSYDTAGSASVTLGLIVVALLGFMICLKIPRTKIENPALRLQWNPLAATISVMKETARKRSVMGAVMAISWFWFFGAAFLSLFPGYTKEVLYAREQVGIFFLTLFSVGIAVGSILCSKLSKGKLELGMIPIGALGMAIFCLDLFFAGGATEALPELMGLGAFLKQNLGLRISFDLFAMAIASGIFIVPLYTLIQVESSEGERSQVIAGNNIWNSLFMVVCSLSILALLAMGVQIIELFLILGVLHILVCSIIFGRSAVYRKRLQVIFNGLVRRARLKRI